MSKNKIWFIPLFLCLLLLLLSPAVVLMSEGASPNKNKTKQNKRGGEVVEALQ